MTTELRQNTSNFLIGTPVANLCHAKALVYYAQIPTLFLEQPKFISWTITISQTFYDSYLTLTTSIQWPSSIKQAQKNIKPPTRVWRLQEDDTLTNFLRAINKSKQLALLLRHSTTESIIQ